MHFVLMLTEQDRTIPDAVDVYREVSDLDGLGYVAFKDSGLGVPALRELVRSIHADRRQAILEVTAEHLDDERRMFDLGVDLGVDQIVGGSELLASEVGDDAPVAYWPFVGEMRGIPLRLASGPAELVDSVRRLSAVPAVAGLMAMPYRQERHRPEDLLRSITSASDLPVLVAGGISQPGHVRSLEQHGAWGFTVGGAVLAGRIAGQGHVRSKVEAMLRMASSPAGVDQ
ncbi:hypothetical protein ACIA49_33810 [Kribbella sp. NPDC051587]|uniref:hypothetical protein n=1 Tax=Kribbella sp. NPDC051587 TaxID=3364119 RepID=UPI00379842B5